MTRTDTALSLKGVNNKFNNLHESTQQDNERKRSTNGTNLPTATCRISLLNSLSFGERRRSLISAIGFVLLVQFVVKTKENDSC